MDDAAAREPTDVLVVGAGPTGLTLALELAAQGVPVRVVDAAADAVHESRALVVQARTLEVLDRLGVADDLVRAGDRASGLAVHGRGRVGSVRLFDPTMTETAYPFLLFLSQARLERILLDHLARAGVTVERDCTLVGLSEDTDGVTATVRSARGTGTTVQARYAVGCDGAHSAVRAALGVAFAGSTYPQTFVLADVDADGIDGGRIHAFLGAAGLMFFFPLGSPVSWRVLTTRTAEVGPATTFADLERLVADRTTGTVTVRDPVWLTDFSISERCVDTMRVGRVLLAGDAAHLHSPAGGQGMNTGIQDAVNLGWKLALVCRGSVADSLLDSYEAERLPVAREVLEATGRVFTVATSSNRLVGIVRPLVGATVLPLLARVPVLRRAAFRAVAELDVAYRSGALLQESGAPRRGVRAGDRVPDGPVDVDGRRTTLHRSLAPTAFTLVLARPYDQASAADVAVLTRRWGDVLRVTRVSGVPGDDAGWVLVRPDGYLGATERSGGLAAVDRFLEDVVGLGPAVLR